MIKLRHAQRTHAATWHLDKVLRLMLTILYRVSQENKFQKALISTGQYIFPSNFYSLFFIDPERFGLKKKAVRQVGMRMCRI